MNLKIVCLVIAVVVIAEILAFDPYDRGNGRRRGGGRRHLRGQKKYAPERFSSPDVDESDEDDWDRPGRGRGDKRGHRWMTSNRREGDRARGRGRSSMEEGSMDFHDMFRGLGQRGRGSDWLRWLFRPRRFHFGLGPEDEDEDSWFDVDLEWGGRPHTTPWWHGPNVCFTRTEQPQDEEAYDGEISTHMSMHSVVCDGSDTSHKCTTKTLGPMGLEVVTELHECCRGYTREAGDFGCSRELELENLGTTLEELGLTELVSSLESAGLLETLAAEDANFTVFAPTNDALAQLINTIPTTAPGVTLQDMNSVVMVSKPIADAFVEDARNLLLGHVVVGSLATPSLSDEMLIETASPFKSKIRVNFYRTPKSLVTANCVPVINADNMATNGVVHVVEKVLPSALDTLLDLVSRNAELSTLKTALGRSDLGSQLREDGQFTLFAPTNSAFDKLDQTLLKKLLGEPTCLTNILKNHVLPNVICSSVLTGQSYSYNLLNKKLNLTRDADDKLYVNGAQIVRADVIGTNGVIYIIDDVLMPPEALNVLELGNPTFVDLVKSASLFKELSQITNATIFMPSEAAIMALNDSLPSDPATVQDILKYHVVPAAVRSCEFYNSLQLATLSGDKKIRINEYSTFPFGRNWIRTAQCARIEHTDTKGCNGIVHTIDKVLIPPKGTVEDVLARDPRFSTLVELVKTAGLADSLREAGPFTVFAPVNEAFEALGSDVVQELKDNPTELKKILLAHVTRDMVCCSGIMKWHLLSRQRVSTMSGHVFPVSRNYRDSVSFDDATVLECDVTATNGVVHAIDAVVQLPRRGRGSFNWRWF